MTRVGRGIRRGLLLALLGFVALQSWYFLHIVYWRYANPQITSFMEIRSRDPACVDALRQDFDPCKARGDRRRGRQVHRP
jgi:hypothetical protein